MVAHPERVAIKKKKGLKNLYFNFICLYVSSMLYKIKFTMPFVVSAVNGFWKRPTKNQGKLLCFSALHQARLPIFCESWGIPDTFEGRFDCASLHVILLLKHIKGSLAQNTFDAFFKYTDLTLREEGVSDLSIGKQIKKCAKFFYGTLKSYHDGLDGKVNLEQALSRNLYGGSFPSSLPKIDAYIRTCNALLANHDFDKDSTIPWPKEKNLCPR